MPDSRGITRIVSLLASCTEWIAALGAQELLVGRSHECDFPPSIRELPVLTRPLATDGTSSEIDASVRSRLRQGLSLFEVDTDLLRRLEPDLILTQTACDVCAVSRGGIEAELADMFAEPPAVFSFEAATFKQVLGNVLSLGRRIGRLPEAMAAVAERERKLKLLRERLGLRRESAGPTAPGVLCVEWIEPLMTAGNWVPDLVEMAGGTAVCTEGGRPSGTVEWNCVLEADPDVIAVMPCGFSVQRTLCEMDRLSALPGWSDISAVRRGDVVVIDGRHYFNRPGPRLYRTVELIAAVLHGERAHIDASPWELQRVIAAPKSEV